MIRGFTGAGSDHCFCERTEGEVGAFSPSYCACILMRLDPLFGHIFLYSHILLLSVSNSISRFPSKKSLSLDYYSFVLCLIF
jgi:hypothetical protein